MAIVDNKNIMLVGLKGPKGDKGDKGERGERGPEGNIGKFVNADINSLENPTANTYYIHTTSPIPLGYTVTQSDLGTESDPSWVKQISDESISPLTFLQSHNSYILKYTIGGVEYTTRCRYAADATLGLLVSDINTTKPFKLLGDDELSNQLAGGMVVGDGVIVFNMHGYGDYAPATYTLPNVEFISLTRLDSNEGVIYFYDGTEFKAIGGRGDKGDSALVFNETIDFDVEPIKGANYSSEYKYFNRTPQVGETFTYPARYADKSYLIQCEVTALTQYVDYEIINVLITTGVQGPQGPAGSSLPAGGKAGQVLTKVDDTDGNVAWVDAAAGGSDFITVDIDTVEPVENTYYKHKTDATVTPLNVTLTSNDYTESVSGRFVTSETPITGIAEAPYTLKFSIDGVEHEVVGHVAVMREGGVNIMCLGDETGNIPLVLVNDNGNQLMAMIYLNKKIDLTTSAMTDGTTFATMGAGIYAYPDFTGDVRLISLTKNGSAYKDGVIYFYDGFKFKAIDGSVEIADDEDEAPEDTTVTFNITSANTEVVINTQYLETYDTLMIDWGDGTTNSEASHTYAKAGKYKVTLYNVSAIGGEGNVDAGEYTGAFSRNEYVEELVGGTYLNAVRDAAFTYCGKLKKVTLKYINVIGASAFRGCKLEEIIFDTESEKFVDIGDYAFAGSELTSIALPLINNMGTHVFDSCSKLKNVKFNKHQQYIPNDTFFSCPKLKKVNFEDLDSLGYIGNNAFAWCYELDTNYICAMQIAESAFYECGKLKEINLQMPSRIEHNAFASCGWLRRLYINGVSEYIADTAFMNCDHFKNIIVEKTDLQSYKDSTNLSDYIKSLITSYAYASDIGNINTELANIIEGEGV